MTCIPFNIPPITGEEQIYLEQVIESRKICGDGEFTRKCSKMLMCITGCQALLTTSCTHALEMAAILANIKTGDEIIMPSYTFVSTANSFVLRGGIPVFIDIHEDTMNMDENLIEQAITSKTKAVVPVHYAGVACEMDQISQIASAYKLTVIEDAAQALCSKYKGKALGGIGDYGCISFHETKNFSSGEGGALLIRKSENYERAEIIREKGTNRSKFWRGEVDKYTWVDVGSSFLPSEINAAYLYPQLKKHVDITTARLKTWQRYYKNLLPLAKSERISLPVIPEHCEHNGHMFYIKVRDIDERTRLIQKLKDKNILAVFHYIPLHSSPGGKKYGRFAGDDTHTTKQSERLLRLPMYYGLAENYVDAVCECIAEFFLA